MTLKSSLFNAPVLTILSLSVLLVACSNLSPRSSNKLSLEGEYFTAPGVNILAFSNAPGGLFFDAKTSGIEVIHRGERTATNGDVRLLPTPEQWDGMGQLVERQIDLQSKTIITRLAYPEYDFNYSIIASIKNEHIVLSVHLDEPLPKALQGKAGFNMEFLPAVYWDKAFLMDGAAGQFPRSASSAAGVRMNENGLVEPRAIAQGRTLVLAPETSGERITIRALSGTDELKLFDGRIKAQNGWYVVRSMIPPNKVGEVVAWELDVNESPGWVREPVIGHSQVGYHPRQMKKAILELDANDTKVQTLSLLRLNEDGTTETVVSGKPESWGQYLRYHYLTYDFSDVKAPGLYQLRYGNQTTDAFPINQDVYAKAWQPTLDFFFPVQMDHMVVKEAYRTWHGRSHMDDAIQAPPNYEHFDLFAHNDKLDTQFKPFEHIPGLNYGGWYDAGDYDIRTQSQYQTVQELVHVYEEFSVNRDNTTISQAKQYTQINRPDGENDLIQQIEHGTLALIAQHRAIGHAIPGIVAGRLYQYPHLGDGSTKTDNKIYRKSMDPHANQRTVGKLYNPSTVDPTPTEDVMPEDGNYSGRFDDRWAFTSNTSALNYGSAAALAAASRALRGYNTPLADECLETAKKVWRFEAGRAPNTYFFGNTTGGKLPEEKLKAAVELLLSTQDAQYKQAIRALLPEVKNAFYGSTVSMLVLAKPFMDDQFSRELKVLTQNYRQSINEIEKENPYGVPITRGSWAGNGTLLSFGVSNYWLHKVFPDIIEKELVYRSLNYIWGTHPDSNYSFASGVGAKSQTQAYGSNRADFSFIPGAVVPGVLVLAPDYPENKSDWPFFWGQNEYVIPMGSRYLFLTHAAEALLK